MKLQTQGKLKLEKNSFSLEQQDLDLGEFGLKIDFKSSGVEKFLDGKNQESWKRLSTTQKKKYIEKASKWINGSLENEMGTSDSRTEKNYFSDSAVFQKKRKKQLKDASKDEVIKATEKGENVAASPVYTEYLQPLSSSDYTEQKNSNLEITMETGSAAREATGKLGGEAVSKAHPAVKGAELSIKAAKKAAELFKKDQSQLKQRMSAKQEVKEDTLKNDNEEGQGNSISESVHGQDEKTFIKAVQVTAFTFFTGIQAMMMPLIISLVVFIAIIGALISVLTVTNTQVIGKAKVTPEVEFYRPYLEKYAAQYPGMMELVDLMLAMIQQESGGEPWIGTMDGDIMQSSESAGYPGPGYLTGEASIAQGVKYLATEVFNKTGLLEDPYDLDKTKLSLQGYNYGSAYIDWALNNYGGYTEENAILYSDMMAAKLGWSSYGDKKYVEHVLQYYELTTLDGSVSTGEIANDETRSKLEEILENNQERYSNYDLDQGRENVITKGCTLAGYTTYDMYGEDTRAGVDLPKTLDCSSFVAWAFHKSGYTDVPYWSTTGTFVESSNFRYIGSSYESLLPGDIGLINMIASGGSNHVGIFVGYDDGGNPMWLHCTSHRCSGSSIEDGPRISYYPSFHLFYRYTGFRDEKV